MRCVSRIDGIGGSRRWKCSKWHSTGIGACGDRGELEKDGTKMEKAARKVLVGRRNLESAAAGRTIDHGLAGQLNGQRHGMDTLGLSGKITKAPFIADAQRSRYLVHHVPEEGFSSATRCTCDGKNRTLQQYIPLQWHGARYLWYCPEYYSSLTTFDIMCIQHHEAGHTPGTFSCSYQNSRDMTRKKTR